MDNNQGACRAQSLLQKWEGGCTPAAGVAHRGVAQNLKGAQASRRAGLQQWRRHLTWWVGHSSLLSAVQRVPLGRVGEGHWTSLPAGLQERITGRIHSPLGQYRGIHRPSADRESIRVGSFLWDSNSAHGWTLATARNP